MKFTYQWLKNHLETEASVEDIVRALTKLGLEVDHYENQSDILSNFVIAEVISVEPHPNADKLKVCKVDDGKSTPRLIVCGAKNVRPGLKTILARPGTFIPAFNSPLKKSRIRGIESHGMLCSFSEINLPDDKIDGIAEIVGNYPPGEPLTQRLFPHDPVIEIDLTPNRGDCLGVRGIARDLAAAGIGNLKPLPPISFQEKDISPYHVHIDCPDLCKHFRGRLIRNVRNQESPNWLKQKLETVGLKPISALVDITNFLSYDLCRPLHAFDVDKISGTTLTVDLAKSEENFKGLDHKSYTLNPEAIVIRDFERILALGGILGGDLSACTDTTTNIFLEAAYFDPRHITVSGRQLGITSDARQRFERGIDPQSAYYGLDQATQLILDICGGQAYQACESGKAVNQNTSISFNLGQIKKRTGVDIPEYHSIQILESLGCDLSSKASQSFFCMPPSWRYDLKFPEDLVEEVLRVWGYESIPSCPLEKSASLPPQRVEDHTLSKIRRLFSGRGCFEAITWSMISHEAATHFTTGNLENLLHITNPISTDLVTLRPSLVPGLCLVAKKNMDRQERQAIFFEIGYHYNKDISDHQNLRLTILRTGENINQNWISTPRPFDIYDCKADVWALFHLLGVRIDELQTNQVGAQFYHPGRVATITQGKNELAVIGELHPSLQKFFGLKERVCIADIDLDLLIKRRVKNRGNFESNNFPIVQRDIAFYVPISLEAEQLLKTLRKNDIQYVRSLDILDLYQEPQAEQKSVTLRVTLQASDHTLSDIEITHTYQEIVKNIEHHLGGSFRAAT